MGQKKITKSVTENIKKNKKKRTDIRTVNDTTRVGNNQSRERGRPVIDIVSGEEFSCGYLRLTFSRCLTSYCRSDLTCKRPRNPATDFASNPAPGPAFGENADRKLSNAAISLTRPRNSSSRPQYTYDEFSYLQIFIVWGTKNVLSIRPPEQVLWSIPRGLSINVYVWYNDDDLTYREHCLFLWYFEFISIYNRRGWHFKGFLRVTELENTLIADAKIIKVTRRVYYILLGIFVDLILRMKWFYNDKSWNRVLWLCNLSRIFDQNFNSPRIYLAFWTVYFSKS